MKKVVSSEKTLREMLANRQFSIDYYQREYRWEARHTDALVEDLIENFIENYELEHEPANVRNYDHYFLGSVVISANDDEPTFIIDGQQRLTSLTLLLVCLYRHDNDDVLLSLIRSSEYEKISFNIDVPSRSECMSALIEGKIPDKSNQIDSVVRIIDRFQDINDKLFGELSEKGVDPDHCLLLFKHWLLNKVHFVEIAASSNADAYIVFETMNDRGLSLTPTEMLKGYLLTNITNNDDRKSANKRWNARIGSLKDEAADAIKSWFRSQYAETTRKRKENASPEDFDKIGTVFHSWIKTRIEEKGKLPHLPRGDDFFRFAIDEMEFYTSQYEGARKAAEDFSEAQKQDLEEIYYNNRSKFTLQYPALLAPLAPTDNGETIRQKMKMVATYIDIVLARRIWNKKSTSSSTMQYNIFMLVIKSIRGKSVPDLANELTRLLLEEAEKFDTKTIFYRDKSNGPKVHGMLARMVDFVEMASISNRESHYTTYIKRGTNDYDIEHILPDKHDEHKGEFPDSVTFDRYRNMIGGLLLLPSGINRSLGDTSYAEKREIYLRENLLSQSLHEKAYENNPGFRRFAEENDLHFKSYSEFGKAQIEERHELYRKLAEKIWDPARIKAIANE